MSSIKKRALLYNEITSKRAQLPSHVIASIHIVPWWRFRRVSFLLLGSAMVVSPQSGFLVAHDGNKPSIKHSTPSCNSDDRLVENPRPESIVNIS